MEVRNPDKMDLSKDPFSLGNLNMTLRPRQGAQKVIQVLSGIFVGCVVLVCVFALLNYSRPSDDGPSPHEPARSSPKSPSSSSFIIDRLKSSVEEGPGPVTLDDLFITVKTSFKFHGTRLAVILKTWFQIARDQTWFFTDGADDVVDNITSGHLVVTDCPADHSRQALCCKMQAEFDAFLASNKK